MIYVTFGLYAKDAVARNELKCPALINAYTYEMHPPSLIPMRVKRGSFRSDTFSISLRVVMIPPDPAERHNNFVTQANKFF